MKVPPDSRGVMHIYFVNKASNFPVSAFVPSRTRTFLVEAKQWKQWPNCAAPIPVSVQQLCCGALHFFARR